jgi:hypothetical protein
LYIQIPCATTAATTATSKGAIIGNSCWAIYKYGITTSRPRDTGKRPRRKTRKSGETASAAITTSTLNNAIVNYSNGVTGIKCRWN